jgi:hypothetical protein
MVEGSRNRLLISRGACRGVVVGGDVILVGDFFGKSVTMAASMGRSGQNKRAGELEESETSAVM